MTNKSKKVQNKILTFSVLLHHFCVDFDDKSGNNYASNYFGILARSMILNPALSNFHKLHVSRD